MATFKTIDPEHKIKKSLLGSGSISPPVVWKVNYVGPGKKLASDSTHGIEFYSDSHVLSGSVKVSADGSNAAISFDKYVGPGVTVGQKLTGKLRIPAADVGDGAGQTPDDDIEIVIE